MCWFIGPACLMANTFFMLNDVERLETRRFRRLARHIEKVLNEHDVMVDWSRPEIGGALFQYQDMFRREKEYIVKVERGEDMFNEDFIDVEFNHRFPDEVISGMRETIKKMHV